MLKLGPDESPIAPGCTFPTRHGIDSLLRFIRSWPVDICPFDKCRQLGDAGSDAPCDLNNQISIARQVAPAQHTKIADDCVSLALGSERQKLLAMAKA
jgi:hypothetical protein